MKPDLRLALRPEAVARAVAGAMLAAAAGLAAAQSAPQAAPLSIPQLGRLDQPVTLGFAGRMDDEFGFRRHLVQFEVDGLKEFALVVEPKEPPPPAGYPVLIVNHGFHPDPKNYGITKDGRNSRPGDYYRQVPYRYAAEGFLAVVPDYRGHNASEGRQYTKGWLASAYYTQDVLAVLRGIGSLEHADAGHVFMWGHSMGGEVTLRALAATHRVLAAAIWSSMGGSLWDQAYYYSRNEHPLATDSLETSRPVLEALKRDIAAAGTGFDAATIEPLNYLGSISAELAIHHSLQDTEANYQWSMMLASGMAREDRPYVFYTYAGTHHLLQGDDFDTAVRRDVALFRSRLGAAR